MQPSKVQKLRKKYQKFIYKGYSWKISGNNLKIFFNFQIKPGISFKPAITIKNINKPSIRKIEERVLNNFIFHLGLMEIPSYWKTTCSSEIEIQAGPLDKEQIRWWKDLIINGMGQFFYENNFDFTRPNFLTIKPDKQKAHLTRLNLVKLNEEKILIPVGGGKDSAVTLEIFKKAKKDIKCFLLNPTTAALKIIRISGVKNPIIVERKIDKKLLELNRKGFLNGHTPFSAYLAFLSSFLALIFDFKYIAVSNERSSNEGNVKYRGKAINHQYSKSFDFEKKFRNYSKKYLARDIEHFSFLRPFYEIQIAKVFSRYEKYFSVFRSCNKGQKKNTWCARCPKCLFVFAILYPFLGERKLVKIFGENLFKKKELLPIILELIGERKFKPFECVGTKKESLIGFYLSWKEVNRIKGKPFLLKYFEKKILPKYKNLERESKRMLNSWNNQHDLPSGLDKSLRSAII